MDYSGHVARCPDSRLYFLSALFPSELAMKIARRDIDNCTSLAFFDSTRWTRNILQYECQPHQPSHCEMLFTRIMWTRREATEHGTRIFRPAGFVVLFETVILFTDGRNDMIFKSALLHHRA